MSPSRWIVAAVLLAGLARPGRADRDIVIESQPERTTGNKLLLAGLGGAGLLAGSLGLYWHLDSRSAADEVSAKKFTGTAWTAEDQGLLDQADRSGNRAIVAYSIGGAFVIGAIVTLILTEPKTETIVIHPRRAVPTVTPAAGGALLGGRWSF